ncbi:putative transcriptional regulatory protein [Lucilia cuprina]|nr:putative transcriptional regulatory protein [Lucilia cuprina]
MTLCMKKTQYITIIQGDPGKKQTILPSPIAVNDVEACIDISSLLENTASRIVSDFSEDQLRKIHSCDVVLMCKWGCDGLSALPEYKQACGMPLRIRSYSLNPSSSSIGNSFKDIWINITPGSKNFCRPIGFKYIKESKKTTKDLVEYLKDEINALEPICIKIKEFSINVSYQLSLTMIDGKMLIFNEKKSQFSNINKSRSINEEVLSFGISPLHARIRFLDYFLHIAYDSNIEVCQRILLNQQKYEELKELRAAEKSGIQEEFKVQMGLNIDKPLPSCGSKNDGNTARFFRDFEITSKITGIDKETVTGCMQITSEHHLHEETKVLPVKEHNVMLTKQFLLGCHRDGSSNFNITQLDAPPRHVRKDLRVYEESIRSSSQNPLDRTSYTAALNDIHRDAINTAVSDANHLFEEVGLIQAVIDKSRLNDCNDFEDVVTEDAIMCGAEEVEIIDNENGVVNFICRPFEIMTLRKSIEASGYVTDNTEHIYIPLNIVDLPPDESIEYRKFITKLKEIPGVEEIYDNINHEEHIDIPQ